MNLYETIYICIFLQYIHIANTFFSNIKDNISVQLYVLNFW